LLVSALTPALLVALVEVSSLASLILVLLVAVVTV
jgi:hypothetical protein